MRNVILSDKDYMEFRGWLRSQPIKWKDSGRSVRIPAWRENVISEDICHDGIPAPQMAYDCLKAHYPDLRLKWRKEELQLLQCKAPKVFRGEYWGELGHIDIKSSYAQLYQYLYLHSDKPFKYQRYPMYMIAQDLMPYKLARNCVVGIARSVEDKWVEKGEVSYYKKVNPYLSPTLWYQISGILNQIANVMLGLGAVWINTDGYLFDQERNYHNAIHWFLDRDIKVSHGWGNGYILAINNYRVTGVKHTDSTDVGKEPIHQIEHSNVDFLKGWESNRERINSNQQ